MCFWAYAGLFRTPQTSLLDSTPLLWILPTRATIAGQSTTRRTPSFLLESVHHNVSDSNNKHYELQLSSLSHKSPEYTHMNTIIKLLYIINQNTSCFFKKTHETPRLHLPPQEATTSQGGSLIRRSLIHNLHCTIATDLSSPIYSDSIGELHMYIYKLPGHHLKSIIKYVTVG